VSSIVIRSSSSITYYSNRSDTRRLHVNWLICKSATIVRRLLCYCCRLLSRFSLVELWRVINARHLTTNNLTIALLVVASTALVLTQRQFAAICQHFLVNTVCVISSAAQPIVGKPSATYWSMQVGNHSSKIAVMENPRFSATVSSHITVPQPEDCPLRTI